MMTIEILPVEQAFRQDCAVQRRLTLFHHHQTHSIHGVTLPMMSRPNMTVEPAHATQRPGPEMKGT